MLQTLTFGGCGHPLILSEFIVFYQAIKLIELDLDYPFFLYFETFFILQKINLS